MFNLSIKKVTILSLSLLCCFFGEQSLKAKTVTKNQSNQNLLLPLPQTYSRVVEYELDLETMTAKQVWTSEIPGEEKVVTFAVGDVDFLPQTGNVLVSYGYLLPKGQLEQFNWDNILTAVAWTRVREFKYTQPAELIWEMEMDSSSNQEGIGWIIFSSERIPSLYPE